MDNAPKTVVAVFVHFLQHGINSESSRDIRRSLNLVEGIKSQLGHVRTVLGMMSVFTLIYSAIPRRAPPAVGATIDSAPIRVSRSITALDRHAAIRVAGSITALDKRAAAGGVTSGAFRFQIRPTTDSDDRYRDDGHGRYETPTA